MYEHLSLSRFAFAFSCFGLLDSQNAVPVDVKKIDLDQIAFLIHRLCLPPLNMRVVTLNFVEAECGRKNVNTKSFLIDLLLRFWRYRFDGSDLPPVLRMPFRRKWRVLRDDSSIWR